MILIRFLLIIISVLYIIRVLARLILPMLFQRVVHKAQQQPNPSARQSNRRPDGTLHVDFIPPKDREAKAADKAGDFIDYEEIR